MSSPIFEIASLLFMDIVNYSTRSLDEQSELIETLEKVVRKSSVYQQASTKEEVLSLPTGDGMALVFLRDPVSPAKCALEIAASLQSHPEVRLRMGLHTGPISRRTDIRQAVNVVGGGINIAQRVMDCGDAGHILLSQSIAAVLDQIGDWREHLEDLGIHEVRHGVKVHVYNLCKGGLGNPARPRRLRSQATPSATSQPSDVSDGEREAERRIEAAHSVGQSLSLHGLRLKKLPDSVGQLKQLWSLDLSDNELDTLPESISHLKQLRKLNLSNNQLAELQIGISQLKRLERLRFPDNRLVILPQWIDQLQQLRQLDCSHNELNTLPESIGELKQLRRLQLTGNRLTALPESICQMRKLRLLDSSNNKLTALPESLGQLSELQSLVVSGNQLIALPESIGQLNRLKVLHLGANQLKNLPESIGFKWLTDLNLSHNQLATLPEGINELKRLKMLALNGNRFPSLPEWIGELENMEVLYVENNHLTSIPLALRRLKALREIYLHENPGLGIPTEILGPSYSAVDAGRGSAAKPAAILDYYFRMRPGLVLPINEAKLILVGRGEVGKTSLVDRLIHGRFQRQQKTEGIHITQWAVQLNDSEGVRLHIWDFGGQEIMHATHQFFLTERSLYLLVLSGRGGGEDMDVEYWLKLIESFGGDSAVIVVLNKIHSHPFDLNRGGLMEKYPGRIRDFIRTDCQDGTGVEELKQAIFRETNRLPHLRDNFPASWFSIKDRLSTMKENYVSFNRYREVCVELDEVDHQAQESLATALHCLGIALNYRDDPRLRESQVLNPHWVTNGIYRILNSELVERNCGELHVDDLGRILDQVSYPGSMHDFLLGLMRKFELCLRFPEPRDQIFLIPQLLGKEQPELGNEFEPSRCLNFRYSYPVWPEGILPRFIVRTHALSIGKQRWRTGVVLEFEGNRALVRADPQEKIVSISVAGPLQGRRRLLAVIRSDFERIHADIPRLNPVASVPLTEDPSITIPYEELRAYETSGVAWFPRLIGKLVVSIEVGKLLDSVELPVEDVGQPVKVFVSYSHKDDDFRAELDTHLKLFERLGLVATWHDRRISPGDEWKNEINRNLEEADLILLLVSPDFIASDYCYEIEMKRALERHADGDARVVPIVVRDVQWHKAPFGKLHGLPKDSKPVRLWAERDSAWRNVAEGLENVIGEMRGRNRA